MDIVTRSLPYGCYGVHGGEKPAWDRLVAASPARPADLLAALPAGVIDWAS